VSDPIKIDVDLDKACTRCGSFGATPRGLCLECIAEEVADRPTDKERTMGKPTQREVVKAEWRRMPEVESIVAEIVAKHHRHLEHAQIVVLGKPKASKALGKVNVAKAKRATEAMNALLRDEIGEVHYIIEIGLDEWGRLLASDRRKVIDHELMHFAGLDEDSERWLLVGHDVEAFTEEIKRHGAWTPELRTFCAAAKQLDLPGVTR
jgi:predicted metallopeptidase